MRKFDEGRTENIRSPDTLAEAFVKKMSRGDVPMADLFEALKAATDSHKKYTVIIYLYFCSSYGTQNFLIFSQLSINFFPQFFSQCGLQNENKKMVHFC